MRVLKRAREDARNIVLELFREEKRMLEGKNKFKLLIIQEESWKHHG